MTEKITLKDIGGYEDEKKEARKLIGLLSHFKEYQEQGAYVPKGLILSGPAGVGKTMFAKAIATESYVPLLEFESTETEDSKETVANLRALFEKARKSTPCIVFIDELDELVSSLHFASDYSRKTLKVLLTEIDGLKNSDGIMIIATTNAREELPLPLIRSGRMDKQIDFSLPDVASRESIFDIYLSKNPILKGISAKSLAEKTENLSGADIKNLINETVIDSISRKAASITEEDIEKNIPEIMFGDIKKARKGLPSERICYHELGHFICGYVLKNEIGLVSTERYGQVVQGFTMYEGTREKEDQIMTVKEMEAEAATGLGGLAAEMVFLKDGSSGCRSDVINVSNIVGNMLSSGALGMQYISCPFSGGGMFASKLSEKYSEIIDGKGREILSDCLEKAKAIVVENKDLLLHLCKPLQEKGRLTKKEMTDLLAGYRKEKTGRIPESC